jgi:hypothetical protein
MTTLRRRAAQQPLASDPQRLPLRWAIIAIVTVAAGLIGYLAADPVAAITCAAVVAVAAHRLLA